MTRRSAGGWYCTDCGSCFSNPGSGLISCSVCGKLGLRGFHGRRPRRVNCPVEGCSFEGWDDGGINDDLGYHQRTSHKEPLPADSGSKNQGATVNSPSDHQARPLAVGKQITRETN
jgi:hypothetical protein